MGQSWQLIAQAVHQLKDHPGRHVRARLAGYPYRHPWASTRGEGNGGNRLRPLPQPAGVAEQRLRQLWIPLRQAPPFLMAVHQQIAGQRQRTGIRAAQPFPDRFVAALQDQQQIKIAAHAGCAAAIGAVAARLAGSGKHPPPGVRDGRSAAWRPKPPPAPAPQRRLASAARIHSVMARA